MPASRLRSAFRSAALFALLALLAGCEGRLHSNPLDPDNPSTGGGPVQFVALAGHGVVTLSWDPAPSGTQVAGFLLERKERDAGAYATLVPVLPRTTDGYVDASALDDVEYQYRLSYVLAGGGSTGSPVVRDARPGPEIAWVADPGSDEVVRFAPDGRAVEFAIPGVTAVNRLAIQLSGGEVWATEPLDGRVRIWDVDGSPLASFNGLAQPNAVAVDAASLTAWICEESGPRVRRWTSGGVVQGTSPLLSLPTDVAVRAGGGAWVVDNGAGRVYRLDASGTPVDTIDVGLDPRRIAVDALDGSIWVSRFTAGEVVHIAANGAILGTATGLEGPYALDVDEFRNQVWVGLDGANAVQTLARSDASRKFRVNGIPRPRGLALADRTGECWVVAIESHELVRIDATGAVQSRYAGLSAPFDVRVDPGPR
jgi:DNA-binding beta-propeller fold protein YncE